MGLVFFFAAFAACADSSSLKAGLWEVKILHQVVDGQDKAAELSAAQERMRQQMANLPPAQRSQMESMFGSKGPSGGQRICISSEMAARNKPWMDPKSHCQTGTVSKIGDRTTYEFSCKDRDRTTVGKGEMIASGDQVHSKTDMTITDSRGVHKMQTETQLTYLGADCQGVKPADQIAKEAGAMAK